MRNGTERVSLCTWLEVIRSMHRLFRVDVRSITVGVVIFCALYLFITQAVNLLHVPHSILTNGLMGFLALFPFLAAGYLTSMRTHPSGVFNSALVGVLSGVLVVMYARLVFSEMPPSYSTTLGVVGGIASSLVLCSLGGVLGTISRHYRQ